MCIVSRLLIALVLASNILAETHAPRPGNNETQELLDWVSSHKDAHGNPYQIESHTALTKDGVKLTLFRLARPGLQPLLLQHGLLDSAWMWVINPTVQSIALHLYDQGFDVWMGNNRGNYFSSSWNRSEPVATSDAFWNFSFADMGVFDVPANIDYILKHTGKPHLQYIAHSQGTTQFFIAAQTPGISEFLKKSVSKFIALSPVAFLGDTTSELLRIFANMHVATKVKSTFPHCFMDSSSLLDIEHLLCVLTAGQFCKIAVGAIVGDGLLDSPAALAKYSDHYPLGTSGKDLQHFAQLMRSNEFRNFDYGTAGNIAAYGTSEPPSYDLSRFSINSALFFGDADDFVRPGDRNRLLAALRSKRLVGQSVLLWSKMYPKFSHVTWQTGEKNATMEFYKDLVQQLKAGQPGDDPPLLSIHV